MHPLEYWTINERVTVFQAALLALEIDPSNFDSTGAFSAGEWPDGYGAIKTAIVAAITDGRVEASVIYESRLPLSIGSRNASKVIDIDKTLVSVNSLRAFFSERHFRSRVFNSMAGAQPDYLNPKSEFYAPKLAAAVNAWIAVSSSAGANAGGTPKQRLIAWLRKSAGDYELTDSQGKLLEDTILQIAKIANWRLGGGPPRLESTVPVSRAKKGI